jgi:hypothetical protein
MTAANAEATISINKNLYYLKANIASGDQNSK